MEPDTITEIDDAEYQFPYELVDEIEAEDFGRIVNCCRTIPCSDPMGCPR